MTIKYCFLVLLLLDVFFYSGCVSTPIPVKPGESKVGLYGCPEPPPSVFTAAGVNAELMKSIADSIVVGKFSITPEVFSLASKAVADEQIRSYLRCLATHGRDPEIC
jgi:hypothetical protein